MRRYARTTSLFVWLLLISTGAYASAQIGRVTPPSSAGTSGGASGYAAAGIHYTLSAADPSRIARVDFTLASLVPNARLAAVRIKLVGASNNYFPCTNAAPESASWECAVGGIPVAAADQFALDITESASSPNHLVWLPLIQR